MDTQAKTVGAFEEIAIQLYELMQQTNLPIWKPGYYNLGQKNGKTGLPYHGINPFILSITARVRNFKSIHWLTFKQVKELGGSVIKGSKAAPIICYFPVNKAEIEQRETERLTDPNLAKIQPVLKPKLYSVFNLDQVEGIEIQEMPPIKFGFIEEIENTISGHCNLPKIEHRINANPSYWPGADRVNMPLMTQYKNIENYYTDLFHELGHATGHQSRLARETIVSGNHNKTEYSIEELVAEFTACFCCSHFLLQPEIEMSAAYLQGWYSFLEDDPTIIAKAIQAAAKAADYIIS